MSPHAAELLLQAVKELGLLAVRDLLVEVDLFAAGKEFTASELVAHADIPRNLRLRRAIEAVGDTVSAKKLGWFFKTWDSIAIDARYVEACGQDADGSTIWRVSPTKPPQIVTATEGDSNIATLPPLIRKISV